MNGMCYKFTVLEILWDILCCHVSDQSLGIEHINSQYAAHILG